MQAERPHLRPEVAGKDIRAIDLLGQRRDLVLCESPHCVAQRICGFAERMVERAIAGGGHVRLRRRFVRPSQRAAYRGETRARTCRLRLFCYGASQAKAGAVEKTRTSTGCPTSTSS